MMFDGQFAGTMEDSKKLRLKHSQGNLVKAEQGIMSLASFNINDKVKSLSVTKVAMYELEGLYLKTGHR